MLEKIFQPLTDFLIQIPNFQSIGLGLVFALAIIPFMPIPAEPVAVPLVMGVDATERESFVWMIAILISTGAFLSHVIVYYLAREHLHKVVGKPNRLTKSHWFHKYGVYAMLVIPSASIIIPPLIDSTMIVLGHYKAHIVKLFAIVFVGEIIRAYFTAQAIFTMISL